MIGFCTNVVLNLTSKRGKHSVFNGLKVQFHNPEVGGSRKGTRRFAPLSEKPPPQENILGGGSMSQADFYFPAPLTEYAELVRSDPSFEYDCTRQIIVMV